MIKKIVLTAFIVMSIASFTLSAAPEKESVTALFFQYSLDNDSSQIDSVGAYMRSSQFNDSQIGSSFGMTFELPIGYSNDKTSMKYSVFGGVSMKYKPQGKDSLLTIGPSVAVTLLTDTYIKVDLIDLGIFVDLATSYPVSETVSIIMGSSLIFDVGRYSIIETASASNSEFAQDFFQLSAKLYLGFSVDK